MPQRRHSEYVRSAAGGKRPRLRSSYPAPNKGARCVTRKRVYSHVLRRHVTRCRKFEGGRVGIRRPPRRLPNGLRCTRRKRVYSLFFRKKVLRCAKYSQQPRFVAPVAVSVVVPTLPAWVAPPAQSAVFTPPEQPAPFRFEPQLLLPADAASLRNRNRMYRRLSRQMRQLKPSQPQVSSRWPGDRPKKRS